MTQKMINLTAHNDQRTLSVEPTDIVAARVFLADLTEVFLKVSKPQEPDRYLQVEETFNQIEEKVDQVKYAKNPVVLIRVKGAGGFSLLINAQNIGKLVDLPNCLNQQIALKDPILWEGCILTKALNVQKPTIEDLTLQACIYKSLPNEHRPEFVRN